MNAIEEAEKLVEAFHAKFGSDKRIHINKDGKVEIVPALPDEMLAYEQERIKTQGC
jgi:hypothetical protein